MTLDDCRRRLTARLAPTGEARALANALLLDALGCDLTELLLRGSEQLPPEAERRLDQMCDRLLAGEPLQYVCRHALFDGLSLSVGPGVLIPRPETEGLLTLAEQALAQRGLTHARILDAGTGSACLALAIKRRQPLADVAALDVCPDALRYARRNAAHLGLTITLIEADLLRPLGLPPSDLVLSNPPYVRLAEAATMSPNVLDHEPHLALFVPDRDPLLFHRALARRCLEGTLAPGGALVAEVNEALANDVASLWTHMGLANATIHNDYTGRPRFVCAHRTPR